MWNCGGGFTSKLLAILDSCGQADIIILVETHLPGGATLPEIPCYHVWMHNRMGALRASGGIAILVHERIAAHAQQWRPSTSKSNNPFHMWLRFDAALGLERPLFLAAAYLPPFRSKYGLRSAADLEEYFLTLGDEVATASALPGGADVLFAGDLNAHTGTQMEQTDLADLLHTALGRAAGEALTFKATGLPLPSQVRANACEAEVCQQGSAVLQFCGASGLYIMNGRLPPLAESAAATCFVGNSRTVVDYLISSPGLMTQAISLRVREPVPEYQQHRPLELILALQPFQPSCNSPGSSLQRQQPAAAACGSRRGG